MEIYPQPPPPVPEILAALPLHDIPPLGPLALGSDVARAFRVAASTLRKWRAEGKFPQPAYRTSIASYYRVADLVAPYYHRSPGEIPDSIPAALLARWGTPDPILAVPDPARIPSEAVRSRYDEETGALNELIGAARSLVGQSQAVEVLAAELAAQRAEIERMREEAERLRAELAEAREAVRRESGWREKSLLDRLRKT